MLGRDMRMLTSDRRISRRRLLAAAPGGLLIAAGIVACGGGDDDASSATATPAPASPTAASGATGTLRLIPLPPAELGAPPLPPAIVSTAASALSEAKAIAEYDGFGADVEPGEFPRTIRHAMGETALEKQPLRVVVLDSGELDSVVRLGLEPVGALDYDLDLVPDYLRDAYAKATRLGTIDEPDVEAIAALTPDLILSSKLRHEALYETLARIAPTVFGARTGVVWKQNFALHSVALGREKEAARVVEEYEARVRELNAKLPDPRPTVSIVRVLEDHLRYYQRANYSGTILSDLGLPRPESQNVDDFALLNQSLETLGEAAPADFIFVTAYLGEQHEFVQKMLASPLWTSLDAVREGRVKVVDDGVWMLGIGYRAALSIMDDIEAALVNGVSGASSTPSGGWSFTDDRGVTVSLPKPPERIVAQTTSAAVLWDFGIRPVGVYGPTDFQAGDIDFDQVELIGDYGTLNLEKLIALEPDLYVDLTPDGTGLWYLTADELEQVEGIVPTLGLSMKGASVIEQIRRFEELVASLGVDVDAPELAAIKADFVAAEADLKDAIAGNPGLTVLVVSPSPDTLYVASPSFMTDLWYLRDLGLDIIDPNVGDYWDLLSWEQANKYPADLILVDARFIDTLDELPTIGVWQLLPAVKADQIGPWYAGAPYSYVQLTPILKELAGIVRNADAGLV